MQKEIESNHGELEHPNRFKRYLILKDEYVARLRRRC